MATQEQYRLMVVGEGMPRVKGVLGFIVPQALDLLERTTYTVAIHPAAVPHGSLHLRRRDGLIATWQPNPNHMNPPTDPPAWTDKVITLSHQLGKDITWQTPT